MSQFNRGEQPLDYLGRTMKNPFFNMLTDPTAFLPQLAALRETPQASPPMRRAPKDKRTTEEPKAPPAAATNAPAPAPATPAATPTTSRRDFDAEIALIRKAYENDRQQMALAASMGMGPTQLQERRAYEAMMNRLGQLEALKSQAARRDLYKSQTRERVAAKKAKNNAAGDAAAAASTATSAKVLDLIRNAGRVNNANQSNLDYIRNLPTPTGQIADLATPPAAPPTPAPTRGPVGVPLSIDLENPPQDFGLAPTAPPVQPAPTATPPAPAPAPTPAPVAPPPPEQGLTREQAQAAFDANNERIRREKQYRDFITQYGMTGGQLPAGVENFASPLRGERPAAAFTSGDPVLDQAAANVSRRFAANGIAAGREMGRYEMEVAQEYRRLGGQRPEIGVPRAVAPDTSGGGGALDVLAGTARGTFGPGGVLGAPLQPDLAQRAVDTATTEQDLARAQAMQAQAQMQSGLLDLVGAGATAPRSGPAPAPSRPPIVGDGPTFVPGTKARVAPPFETPQITPGTDGTFVDAPVLPPSDTIVQRNFDPVATLVGNPFFMPPDSMGGPTVPTGSGARRGRDISYAPGPLGPASPQGRTQMLQRQNATIDARLQEVAQAQNVLDFLEALAFMQGKPPMNLNRGSAPNPQ